MSVMVPPIGTVLAGVNTMTGFMAAPAAPPEVIEVKTSCVNIPPEATPADATESASVCKVMPVALPTVAAPIATPLRVMVKAVAAPMPVVEVMIMIAVAVGGAAVPVMVRTDASPAAK